jgi:hypothetical protein
MVSGLDTRLLAIFRSRLTDCTLSGFGRHTLQSQEARRALTGYVYL